jgi:hypothetical protein
MWLKEVGLFWNKAGVVRMYENVREKIHWGGRSGRSYSYNVYKMGTKFKRIPANYILAQITSIKKWKPVYIGQTSDLSDYTVACGKIPCVGENEPTHIHVHKNDAGLRARLAEELDLVERWHPACNN